MIFSATSRPGDAVGARCTTPSPPAPRRSSSSYRSAGRVTANPIAARVLAEEAIADHLRRLAARFNQHGSRAEGRGDPMPVCSSG